MKKKLVTAGAGMVLLFNVGHAQITNQSGSTVTSSGQSDASSTAQSGTSSVSLTFQAADQQPYMPGTVSGPVMSPTLFNIQGRPAQVAGLQVLSQNFFSTELRDVTSGKSHATKIIYNGARVPKKAESGERKILFDFSGKANGRIIGSLTVQSRKNDTDEVDFPTIIHDATHYVADLHDLKGYDVLLLSFPEMISYGIGVDSKGRGLTLAPVVSGLINGPLGALTGLSSGFSTAGGVTVPTATLGCTFLLVIQDEHPQSIDLALSYVKPGPPTPPPPPPQPKVENELKESADTTMKKMYESTKNKEVKPASESVNRKKKQAAIK